MNRYWRYGSVMVIALSLFLNPVPVVSNEKAIEGSALVETNIVSVEPVATELASIDKGEITVTARSHCDPCFGLSCFERPEGFPCAINCSCGPCDHTGLFSCYSNN